MALCSVGEAMERLGLVGTSLAEMLPYHVRRAFGVCAKACHPDTGAARGYSIGQLQEARDVLMAHLSDKDLACQMCNGSGKVRARLGAQDCPACSGTGDQK